jgi:hypothetical protein
MYVDSLLSEIPSIGGLKGGSIFTNGLGYDLFYPWKSTGEHPNSLMRFIHDVGVPHTLISDNAKEECPDGLGIPVQSSGSTSKRLSLMTRGRTWPNPAYAI